MKDVFETPTSLALLTCDTIITDARTGKKSLVGLFNSIGSSVYPYLMREFFVFASMTNCEGDTKISIRLQAANGDIIFELPGKVPCKTLLDSPEIIFNLQNLVIKAPGTYELMFIVDGKQIASRLLTFRQIVKPNKDALQEPPPAAM